MWLGELWPPKEGNETADVQKGSEFKTKVSENIHCTFNHTHLKEQKRKGGEEMGKKSLPGLSGTGSRSLFCKRPPLSQHIDSLNRP